MARHAPLPPPRGHAGRAHRGPLSAVDVATVYSWLCRFTEDPAECERLLVEVLRRSRTGAPACLEAASDATRLQFLTVESVLRLRGVL